MTIVSAAPVTISVTLPAGEKIGKGAASRTGAVAIGKRLAQALGIVTETQVLTPAVGSEPLALPTATILPTATPQPIVTPLSAATSLPAATPLSAATPPAEPTAVAPTASPGPTAAVTSAPTQTSVPTPTATATAAAVLALFNDVAGEVAGSLPIVLFGGAVVLGLLVLVTGIGIVRGPRDI